MILPALRGGLFTGALLTFAHSLGEFGATVLVSGNLRLKTQTAPLYIFAQFEAGNIAAANAVAAVLAHAVVLHLLLPAALHGAREAALTPCRSPSTNVTKRYADQTIVDRVSLEVADGRALRAARRLAAAARARSCA